MDDVIVVGAGPAGNNAALALARRGYAVTVIDWRHNIGDKLCSGVVGRECTRRFPIDPQLVYRDLRSAQVVAPVAASICLEAEQPQAQVINRVAYVASIAQRARAAGVTYLLGQRVHQVLLELNSVAATTDEGTYRARAVVLATGFSSPLTRQIGLGSVADYVTGIQAEVYTKDLDDVVIYLGHDVAPGFFAWVIPTLPRRALVGLLARRGAPTYLDQFLQRLRSEGTVTQVLKEAACWAIPLRPLKRTYQDRVLVVGDAAGQVKPTTGGGIYYSLLASEIAAEVLASALVADDLSTASLSRYQRRWQTLLSRELEMGYSARRLYEFLTDQQISSLVQKAASNGIRAELVNSAGPSFDWHSHIITKVLSHPVMGRALRLVNPVLARLAYSPNDPSTIAAGGLTPSTPESAC